MTDQQPSTPPSIIDVRVHDGATIAISANRAEVILGDLHLYAEDGAFAGIVSHREWLSALPATATDSAAPAAPKQPTDGAR